MPKIIYKLVKNCRIINQVTYCVSSIDSQNPYEFFNFFFTYLKILFSNKNKVYSGGAVS